MQTHICTCDVEYCDFVAGTFRTDCGAIFVERILRDEGIWKNCLASAEVFFRKCHLPALMGKWWTSSSAWLSQVSPITTKSSGLAPPCPATSSAAVTTLPSSTAPAVAPTERTLPFHPASPLQQNVHPQDAALSDSKSTRLGAHQCRFCGNVDPIYVVHVCHRCGVRYHQMCQTKHEEGRLCDHCVDKF